MGRVSGCVVALVLTAWAAPALADCADVPKPGVDWRRCVMSKRDFSGVDLSGARLKDGRYLRSKFVETNFSGADLRRTKFIEADAHGAIFDKARLNGADLTNANLAGASFKGANLTDTAFYGANMTGVDFTGAKIHDAILTGANLAGARWIDGETICAEDSVSQCN